LSKRTSLHSKTTQVPFPKNPSDSVFRCAHLHPDGHVYAIGCEDGSIRVYDILTGQLNGTLGPHPSSVQSIHFSSNGYWLAETCTEDSLVRIWDLRKATAVAFELEGSSVGGSVRWDHSGQFLALGGKAGVDVWGYIKKEKKFEKMNSETLLPGGVRCLDWGLDGKIIVCGGTDDATICQLGVRT
jgi:pre-mRNA-processing factor 19